MKTRCLALICALVLCAILLPSALADGSDFFGPTTAFVVTANKGSLNVRREMSTSSEIITTANYGQEVEVLGTYANGTWTEISFRKEGGLVNGYVMSRYLSFNRPTSAPKATATPAPSVTTLNFSSFKQVEPYAVYANPERVSGWVNLRWAPSTACEVIERCPLYYQLVIIAQSSTWAQAYDPQTGVVGFISRKYVKDLGYGVTLNMSTK